MPTASASAAREILTGLHEVMASRANAQSKLNHVVKIIAEAMQSEVCSIYLLRDGVLELFATLGLNQSAVHVTKLALGEGLVGTIAEDVSILNLDEASRHPEFAYRPETGEELFHSFAGVPIIRRERAIGVLCVQHADPRAYDHLEIEALQTVAMVVSELIANAGLADKATSNLQANREAGSLNLRGFKIVTGMAAGSAVYHQPRVLIEHTVAEDTEAERHRVYSAFRKMREQIDTMTNLAEFGKAGEHQEILETYKMFAMTRAGRGGSTSRSTAALPRKPQSSASVSAPKCECARSTTRCCRSVCTTSTICRTGSSVSSRASSARRRRWAYRRSHTDRPQSRARRVARI
jgi:phosphotransferase system enzyme I (PtsP)